jgi:hypothetical protein
MVLVLAGEEFLSVELVLCMQCARIHYVRQHVMTESEGVAAVRGVTLDVQAVPAEYLKVRQENFI